MDGTVEAHNISFSCGHLAINIALPHGEYDWSHLKYRAFEQRSGKKKERKEEKNMVAGVSLPFFHLLSNHPSAPPSSQCKVTQVSHAFSGTLKNKTSVKQK